MKSTVLFLIIFLIQLASPTASGAETSPEQELESLLDSIDVVDEGGDLDPRGKVYVERAEQLEAEIAADRKSSQKRKRELFFRMPRTSSLVEFDKQVEANMSTGAEFATPPNAVQLRRMRRERLEQSAGRFRPLKVKEFAKEETIVLLRDLRDKRISVPHFSADRPRNYSGSARSSSLSESYSDEIETEATRIMQSLFRSGNFEESVHPGAAIRSRNVN